MPRYEYECTANGRVVEVSHSMGEKLATWGELCARAGIEPGATDAAAPIHRLMSVSNVAGSKPATNGGGGHVCGGGCRH